MDNHLPNIPESNEESDVLVNWLQKLNVSTIYMKFH